MSGSSRDGCQTLIHAIHVEVSVEAEGEVSHEGGGFTGEGAVVLRHSDEFSLDGIALPIRQEKVEVLFSVLQFQVLVGSIFGVSNQKRHLQARLSRVLCVGQYQSLSFFLPFFPQVIKKALAVLLCQCQVDPTVDKMGSFI